MDNPTLERLDRAILTGPVCQALGKDTVEITDWQAETFHRGMAEVHRISGNATKQGETVTFALILKVAHRWDDDNPGSLFYWKREPFLYQSSLLSNLPGGLFTPRCLGIDEPEPGLIWLWLEEISDDYRARGDDWPLSGYSRAAHHLGRFNGAYLVNHPKPDQPWLSRHALPTLAASAEEPLSQMKNLLVHPLVRRACPATSAARLVDHWQERQALLNLPGSLPQTFCHRDTASSNLFLTPDDVTPHRLGIIDWTLAGQGAVGEEIATLLMTSLLSFDIAPTMLPVLEEIIVHNYLEGLREAGWRGKTQLVRLGFLSAVILRFGFNFLAGTLPLLAKEETYHRWEQVTGHSIEEIADRRAQVLESVLTYADEAKQLLQHL